MLRLLVKFGDLGRDLGSDPPNKIEGRTPAAPREEPSPSPTFFCVCPAATGWAVCRSWGRARMPGWQSGGPWRTQFGRGGPPESPFLFALSLFETSWAGDPHWWQAWG